MTEITKLKEVLKKVGLHNIAKPNFDLGVGELDNLAYLEYIITQEIRMRDQKNIAKRFKSSKLNNKLLKDFDATEVDGITPWQLEKFETLEFVENFANIIITGNPGVGKTHIANGVGNVAVAKGVKTYYITLVGLLTALNVDSPKNRKTLEYIKECKLIIIDEFMYTNLTEKECNQIYHYLTDLNRTKSLIIITNKQLSQMDSIFPDKLLGATLMDRLTENAHIINIRGESYRQKCMGKATK